MKRYRPRKAPAHRKVKLSEPNPGYCRFCNFAILSPMGAILTRKTWHRHCVKSYKEQAHPSVLRKAIWDRDKGICAKCGVDVATIKKAHLGHMSLESIAYSLRTHGGDYWQADHIVPLAAGGSFEHHNVQTLCIACHKAKLKADLAMIAQYRKGGGIPHEQPWTFEKGEKLSQTYATTHRIRTD